MGVGEVQAEYKEKLFSQMDNEAVEQVALRGCSVSVLCGFQAPARPRCEEPKAGPTFGT